MLVFGIRSIISPKLIHCLAKTPQSLFDTQKETFPVQRNVLYGRAGVLISTMLLLRYTQLCMDYDYNVVRDPCNSDSDSEGNACEEIFRLAERFWPFILTCVSTLNLRSLAGLR